MPVKNKHRVAAANGATYLVTDVSDNAVVVQVPGMSIFVRITRTQDSDSRPPMYTLFMNNKNLGLTSHAAEAVMLAVDAIDMAVKPQPTKGQAT